MATKGTVSGVIANMVTLVVDGPVAQNEICYISTGGEDRKSTRLNSSHFLLSRMPSSA